MTAAGGALPLQGQRLNVSRQRVQQQLGLWLLQRLAPAMGMRPGQQQQRRRQQPAAFAGLRWGSRRRTTARRRCPRSCLAGRGRRGWLLPSHLSRRQQQRHQRRQPPLQGLVAAGLVAASAWEGVAAQVAGQLGRQHPSQQWRLPSVGCWLTAPPQQQQPRAPGGCSRLALPVPLPVPLPVLLWVLPAGRPVCLVPTCPLPHPACSRCITKAGSSALSPGLCGRHCPLGSWTEVLLLALLVLLVLLVLIPLLLLLQVQGAGG